MKKISKKRKGIYSTILLILLTGTHTQTHSSSLGLEYGVAGVENFDFPEPSFGISGNVSIYQKFQIGAAGYNWHGTDGNYLSSRDSISSGAFYKNTGARVTLWYRLHRSNTIKTYAGLALSAQELLIKNLDDSSSSSYFYFPALEIKLERQIYNNSLVTAKIGATMGWATFTFGYAWDFSR